MGISAPVTCSWKKRRRRDISLHRLTCAPPNSARQQRAQNTTEGKAFGKGAGHGQHLAGIGAGKGLALGVEVLELQQPEVAQLRDRLVRRVRRDDELHGTGER